MIPTLVDANVILDVLTQDPVWREWSEDALAWAARQGPLVINLVVYSEIAPRFAHIEDLDRLVDEMGLARADIPWTAAYLASRAHHTYRNRGGGKSATLPDFYIGAHAAVRGWSLLTRDARRFRTYFPTVELIAPAEA